MWLIIKIKKNCIHKELKINLKKILNSDPTFYCPKILKEVVKGNKFKKKDFFILGNYLLIFHERFQDKLLVNKLNFLKGIDVVLDGFKSSQKEIINFINKCKQYEDKNGYLLQNFFVQDLSNKLKFHSGPFVNFAVKLIEVQKNKLRVLAGKYDILISTKDKCYLSC